MLCVLPPTNQTCLATIRLLQVAKTVVKESRERLPVLVAPFTVALVTLTTHMLSSPSTQDHS